LSGKKSLSKHLNQHRWLYKDFRTAHNWVLWF